MQALLTFDEAGYKTVPKLKALYDILGQLKAQRRELIGDYAAAKKDQAGASNRSGEPQRIASAR